MTIAVTAPPIHCVYALHDGEGDVFWWESQLFSIKSSLAGLGLVDGVVEAGSEPPLHIHSREDEFIYVLEGTVTVYLGDTTCTCGPGGFVFMPRNQPHTFAVEDTGLARILIMFTPHGCEQVFSEHRTADYVPGVRGPRAGRHDLAVLGEAFADAGISIVGPHPRDAA